MRIYKVVLEVMDKGKPTLVDYYLDKSIDVRTLLARLHNDRDVQVVSVSASPEFDKWERVEVN